MFNYRSSEPISLEHAKKIVPAIFADKPHESRSDKYVHIPTIEVVQNLLDNDFSMYALASSKSRRTDRENSKKHVIRFRHSGTTVSVGETFYELVLVNSHDGSSSLQMMAGMFRLICSNGLVVSNNTFGSFSVRHQKITMSDILNQANVIVEKSEEIYELRSEWQKIQLNYVEKYELAQVAIKLKFADRYTPITPDDFLKPRRIDDNKNDLWTVFNVIQENLINGGISARGQRRMIRTRPINNIYQNINFNQALWEAANKIALEK